MKAGAIPVFLGQIKIDCEELMFYQYLPVVMPGTNMRLPRNLECFLPLFDRISYSGDDYVYLTAKKLYVGAGDIPNRPGWHIDGFGTEDSNYIWSDSVPTEFCIQDFDLSDDHDKSLIEMERQAKDENIRTYPDGSFLSISSRVVHRVGVSDSPRFRTFAKISVSKHRYNLLGNAHNYLFDYKWEMIQRRKERNHPIGDAG